MRQARIALTLVGLLVAGLPPASGEEPRSPELLRWKAGDPSAPIVLGAARRGYLGVDTVELSPGLRAHYGAPDDRGVMVSRVVTGAPADRGGLRVGDVILAVQQRPVASTWALKSILAGRRGGDPIRLTIVREGRRLELPVTLEEHEATIADIAPFVANDRQGRMILLDPERTRMLLPHRVDAPALAPPEELERALETATRTLRVRELPPRVRAEIAERRRLEQRIRELEARLRQVEAELERRGGEGE